MTKSMIRVTWHITTIAFLVLGSAMAACAAAGSNRTCEGVGQVAAISYTGFAVLTIVLGAQQLPKALLRHPAPLLFVSVAGFAWWGSTV